MNLSINPFTTGSATTASSVSDDQVSSPIGLGAPCPSCGGDVMPVETETGWQSCPSARIGCRFGSGPSSARTQARRPRFQTKRHVFFIRTRRFRLAANAAADLCARYVICSWEQNTFARHASSAGAPIPGWRPARRNGGIAMCSMIPIALTIGWGWILFWPVNCGRAPRRDFLAREVS